MHYQNTNVVTKNGEIHLKIHMEFQGTQNNQKDLGKKKKNKVRRLIFPISKVTTNLQLSQECGTANKDQWNRTEDPEIIMYGQLIFNKGTNTTPWGNNSLFNKLF